MRPCRVAALRRGVAGSRRLKAVEDELGAGEGGADGADVAPEHVEADDADRTAAPRPEAPEELLQGFSGAAVARSRQAALKIVDDAQYVWPLARLTSSTPITCRGRQRRSLRPRAAASQERGAQYDRAVTHHATPPGVDGCRSAAVVWSTPGRRHRAELRELSLRDSATGPGRNPPNREPLRGCSSFRLSGRWSPLQFLVTPTPLFTEARLKPMHAGRGAPWHGSCCDTYSGPKSSRLAAGFKVSGGLIRSPTRCRVRSV